MTSYAPVFREETSEDIARDALLLAEWREVTEHDTARVGGMPYRGFRCPVCQGVRADSADLTGDGHKYWCVIAEALKALGEEPEQEDAPEEYNDFVAVFKRRLDAGEETTKVAYDIIHDSHQSGFDRGEILVKIFRELGLRVIEVPAPT